MSLTRILVPTDFSEAANQAFRQAVALIDRQGSSIHLLHCLEYPVPTIPGPFMDEEPERVALERLLEAPRREAENRLEKLAAEVEGKDIRITSSIEETRPPFDAILSKVEDWNPHLVCMGTHGREGVEKLLMGSVAEKVLRHVPCQLLVLRAGSQLVGQGDERARILLPVDFSDYSQRALGAARELRDELGGTIHLLHVVELLHTPFKPGGLTSPFDLDPSLREKCHEALKGMLGDDPGDVTVTDGGIAGEILLMREKLGANLIIMGCRGRTGIKHFLVGSVTEKTVRFSEVPVWIVK